LLKRQLLPLLVSATTLVGGVHPASVVRPLVFEPNRGQASSSVNWLAHRPGYQLMLTNEGLTMRLKEGAAVSSLKMTLKNSRPWRSVTGLEPTGGTSNYLHGTDSKAWRTNIPQYASVRASRVYDGIDLVLHSQGPDLEYDFVVAPGADPKRIALAFSGMDRLRVDEKSGDLILTTPDGAELRQARPRVYQEVGNRRVEVAGGYELRADGAAGFRLAAYDRRRPLVIDPIVTFTTFLRGSDFDAAEGVAVDSAGNAYIGGTTLSDDFPTINALQLRQGFFDGFVTKLSPQGTILFSTYLGGSDDEEVNAIAVDSTGVYVTGFTASTDFPGQVVKKTDSVDTYVTKLLLDGGGIVYTTIVGSPTTRTPPLPSRSTRPHTRCMSPATPTLLPHRTAPTSLFPN
jgi:hypothetical protein